MPLTVGVLKETSAHEARVALTPDVTAKLAELKVEVRIERGAGQRSHLADDLYRGAVFEPAARDVLLAARVLLKVQPPTLEEVDALTPGAVVVGFLQPH